MGQDHTLRHSALNTGVPWELSVLQIQASRPHAGQGRAGQGRRGMPEETLLGHGSECARVGDPEEGGQAGGCEGGHGVTPGGTQQGPWGWC